MVHHFRNGSEIPHRLSIRSKHFAMFGSILSEHTTLHGGSFESAHGMTVTVCATHQAQNDFRGVRSAAKCGEVRIAPPVLFQVDVLVPISAVKGNLQARRRQSANVR